MAFLDDLFCSSFHYFQKCINHVERRPSHETSFQQACTSVGLSGFEAQLCEPEFGQVWRCGNPKPTYEALVGRWSVGLLAQNTKSIFLAQNAVFCPNCKSKIQTQYFWPKNTLPKVQNHGCIYHLTIRIYKYQIKHQIINILSSYIIPFHQVSKQPTKSPKYLYQKTLYQLPIYIL